MSCVQTFPHALGIDLLDRAFLSFYSHVRDNSRRLTHLVIALFPLMVLLVGSCNMSQLPWSFGSTTRAEQVRTALFPDRAAFQGVAYRPAAGYISRARSFVESEPDSLLLMTQQEIGFLFGKPTFHRKDANAEVWQYKTGACVADLYFYNEKGRPGQSPLSYVDIRLEDEMKPGSSFRLTPLSKSEKSVCLKGVLSQQTAFGFNI
jgi:hypothetical protein